MNVVELVCEPEDTRPDPSTGEVKTRLRVRWVNRAGGLVMKNRLDDDKKKILAAKMKAKIAAFDAKAKREGNGAAPASAGPPGPNPPPMTDDIPF